MVTTLSNAQHFSEGELYRKVKKTSTSQMMMQIGQAGIKPPAWVSDWPRGPSPSPSVRASPVPSQPPLPTSARPARQHHPAPPVVPVWLQFRHKML